MPTTPPRLVVRCDAGRGRGAGHLVRCLAIAQEFKARGGEVTFLSACDEELLRAWVRADGCRLVPLEPGGPAGEDLARAAEVVRDALPAWCVLDGYQFDADYLRGMRATGARVLVVDDLRRLPRYDADVILNPNLGAEDWVYPCDPETRVLLGPDYALLRREFLRWRGWRRRFPARGRKVLVTLGGSDAQGHAAKALSGVRRAAEARGGDLEVLAVIGFGSPHEASLRRLAEETPSPYRLRIETGLREMASRMAWADVAVSAGGSTCWELACMGLPNLILVRAENQLEVARRLDRLGVSRRLGWVSDVTEEDLAGEVGRLLEDRALRRRMSEKGRALVDGAGAGRVCEAMAGLAH